MANKIKITTTELKDRAGRMDALNDRLDSIITQMNGALKKIDNSTCAKFSSNIIVKTAALRRNMQNARNYLLIGAAIAKKCAESYTNADTVIRQHVVDINTPEVQKLSVSAQTVNHPLLSDTYVYADSGVKYVCIENFENYSQKQKWKNNCTSTAWCMGLSMITGKEYDPTSSDMWGEQGAKYPGQGKSVWGNESNMLTEAYNQLQEGKPCVFFEKRKKSNGSVSTHAVTIVGLTIDANPDDLTMDDFLVIDPGDGKTKKLSEIGYYPDPRSARLITYGNSLP